MGEHSTAPAAFERRLDIPDAGVRLLELGQQFNVPTPGNCPTTRWTIAGSGQALAKARM
jgi:hypothetical protein